MGTFDAAASAAAHNAFYSDWSFWAVVIAALALCLSQIPPLWTIFRRGHLELFIHRMIQVTHKVGNPNLLMFLTIGSRGGRDVRIDRIHAIVQREGQHPFDIEAQAYYEKPSDPESVLLVPLRLKSKERWSHSVAFHNLLNRQDDKDFRRHLSVLQADISEKLSLRDADANAENRPVVAEQENYQYFIDTFGRRFIWEPGEYNLDLIVECTPSASTIKKQYRFTLYESDTEDLKKHAEDYNIGGGGLTFHSTETHRVLVPILPRNVPSRRR